MSEPAPYKPHTDCPVLLAPKRTPIRSPEPTLVPNVTLTSMSFDVAGVTCDTTVNTVVSGIALLLLIAIPPLRSTQLTPSVAALARLKSSDTLSATVGMVPLDSRFQTRSQTVPL